MTADSYGTPRPRGALHRATVAWGHFSLRWEIPLVVLTILSMAAEWWMPADISMAALALYAVLAGVAPLLLTSGLAGQVVHDKSLCLRCLHAAPLHDPQGAVDAADPWLRLYHNSRRMWTLLSVAAVPLALLLLDPDRFPWPLRAAATVSAVVGMAALIVHSRAHYHHRLLQRWCRYCRRPDDGDERTPVQPPVPSGSRER